VGDGRVRDTPGARLLIGRCSFIVSRRNGVGEEKDVGNARDDRGTVGIAPGTVGIPAGIVGIPAGTGLVSVVV